MTIYDIAHENSVSETTVRRWAKKAGVAGKRDRDGLIVFGKAEAKAIVKAGKDRGKPGPKK